MKIEIQQVAVNRAVSELLPGDAFYLFDNPDCPLIYIGQSDDDKHETFDLTSLNKIFLKGYDEVGIYRNFKFVGEV